MTPKTLTTGLVTPSSYINYAITFYKIDITLLDPIPAGGSIIIIFPSTVVPQSASLVAASFGISSCMPSLGSNTINITNCFSASMTNLALSVNFSNIQNPPSFRPTDTLKFYTRGPQNNLINQL